MQYIFQNIIMLFITQQSTTNVAITWWLYKMEECNLELLSSLPASSLKLFSMPVLDTVCCQTINLVLIANHTDNQPQMWQSSGDLT